MKSTIVLGSDPGFAFLGLGVVEVGQTRSVALHHETFTTDTASGTDDERLDMIAQRIIDTVNEFRPTAIAYENQSGVTAGKEKWAKGARSTVSSRRVHEVCGIIRGIARTHGLPCYVHAPNTVKLAVLGRGGGNASKEQVKRAVRAILYNVGQCSSHAADALAAAVCGGRYHALRGVVRKGIQTRPAVERGRP